MNAKVTFGGGCLGCLAVLIVLVAVWAIAGAVVLGIWNLLLIGVFGLPFPTLTFVQAMGVAFILNVLAAILGGGKD